jgi:copper resistance protein B
MKARLALLALALVASPAAAQEHDHGSMDHGSMDHSAMDHGSMDHGAQTDQPAQDPHAGMDHSMHHAASTPASPDDTPGNAPPPPVPSDHAADALFGRAAMERARREMVGESRFRTTVLSIDALEYRAHKGGDGYLVEGMVWTGGDTDRAVLAFEGEGAFGEKEESLRLDGYWSHAVNPWFNLQLGARHDLRPDPERTYALVGLQGLLPYWIEAEGQLFVSNKGDVHLSAKASHDIRVTQRLVVEPEVELDFAMQDVPELGVGAGFDTLELSARARYELARNFAPYLGVAWERKLGGSADFARLEGEKPSVVSFVIGLRAWF